jgi:aquaporin Z
MNVAKYVVEFIGTFFLVLTIGLVSIPPGAGDLAPLAIGAVLMVMIFAGGYVSGAHYNPAITVAMFLRGRCPLIDIAPYMVAQLIGAVFAALLALYLKPPVEQPMKLVVAHALIAEFLFTFALAYVILNVATAKGTSGNPTYGLAIGFTVLAGAYAVGNISGAAFNPAVAVAITIMGISTLANIWIYLVASFAGAIAAAALFRLMHPTDK